MKINYIADKTTKAKEILKTFNDQGFKLINAAENKIPKNETIIVIGGDGFMLHILHKMIDTSYKFYGVNAGSVGFLLNKFNEKKFSQALKKAELTILNPLRVNSVDTKGNLHSALAINEVALFRETNQASHLRVLINDKVKIDNLVGDGLLIATPAGSSAYNFSAGGAIIPLEANILAMTSLNSYKPRRWNGALIPDDAKVTIEVLQHSKRPVSASADYNEVRNIKSAEIFLDKSIEIKLLFDPEHSLEERILNEQFI